MTTARFDCQYCTASLLGKKYVLKNDNPYCVSCYDRIFSNYCEECKEPIESDSKVGLFSIYCMQTNRRMLWNASFSSILTVNTELLYY